MKNHLIIIAILATLFFAGCKKDNSTALPNCKITSIIENDNENFRNNIKYDEQNRVSELSFKGGYYKYIYSGLSGVLQTIKADTVYNTDYFTVDGDGKLTSIDLKFTYPSGTYYYRYILEYNSDGYLTTCSGTSRVGSTVRKGKDSLIYENGNMIKQIDTEDGIVTYIREFTYSTNENKSWSFYLNNGAGYFPLNSIYYFLNPLLGKHSKNLPHSLTVTNRSGTSSSTGLYNYSFDANGYVTEYNNITGGLSINYKITQTCN